MGLDHTLQSTLDPGCPLFGVSPEEHRSYLETPGPGHGRVQKAEVPQRHTTSIKVHDSLPKIPASRKRAATGTSPVARLVVSHALTISPMLPLDPTKCLKASPPSMMLRSPPTTASTERTF